MIQSLKRRVAVTCATGALAVAGVAAAPAAAAPVFTGGLVKVTLVDVLDVNNNQVQIQVPIGVAANLCDINAAVLVQEFQDTGTADCDSTATSRASAGQGR